MALKSPSIAYRFGQATLMHVLVACTPLPASTGMVHGPWGTGHPVTVVAGVGWVVGSVGMMVVMVVAPDETLTKTLTKKKKSTDAHLLFLVCL